MGSVTEGCGVRRGTQGATAERSKGRAVALAATSLASNPTFTYGLGKSLNLSEAFLTCLFSESALDFGAFLQYLMPYLIVPASFPHNNSANAQDGLAPSLWVR